MRGGNQLGIVLNDGSLTEEEMLVIAKQFNYSESTFIENMGETGVKVRIFLPNREIPFAGHPTIGTSYIVEKLWRENNPPRYEIILDLKLGPIRVEIDNENAEFCIMNQFPPKYFGVMEDRQLAAEMLGIEENDLLDVPIYKISPSDLPFVFIGVISASILEKMKPKYQMMADKYADIGGEAYVYTMDAKDGGDVRARLFAPLSGISEDPATGSAQASLALALLKSGLINMNNQREKSFITEQGYEMGRPSKLYNTIIVENGELISTKTGGESYLVSKGVLFLD